MRVCPTCFGLFGPNQQTCPKDGVATVHHTHVLIGMSLGPYIVRSHISEGGMGVVYAGEHPTLGRRVALKVLRPELSLNDPIVERFTQEARAVNTIGHKNIVSIYDFGRTPFGSFYIVMEYLDGRTVRDLIDETGALGLAQASFIVDQVGEALEAAHRKGFIHRDVKPENVMVCHRGGQRMVKLLDFGIAKLLTRGGGDTQQTGSAMGTPQYMSPEQLEDGRIDNRTDIYSLGAVAYEMLTGQVPYGGSSHAAVRQLQLTKSPPPPSICRRDIRLARTLDAAILQAVNLDPARRFPDMETFLAAFGQGVADTQAQRGVAEETPGRQGALGALIAGFVVLLLAAGGLIVWLVARDGTPATVPRADRGAQTAADVGPAKAGAPTQQVRQHIATTLTTGSPAQRKLATQYLADRRCASWEAALRERLEVDDDPRVRRFAARALGDLGQAAPETLSALRKALHQYARRVANPWLRLDIATALARLGDPTGIGSLRRDLSTAKGILRSRVLEALARARHPAGAELAKHIADAMPETRFRRLGYLAVSPNKKVAARARRQLRLALSKGAWDMRLQAAIALAPAEPSPARALLSSALDVAPADIRRRAAIALALRLGDARGGRNLLKSLHSVDERQAADVALGLGVIRSKVAGSAEALARAFREGEKNVKLAAAIALLDC